MMYAHLFISDVRLSLGHSFRQWLGPEGQRLEAIECNAYDYTVVSCEKNIGGKKRNTYGLEVSPLTANMRVSLIV